MLSATTSVVPEEELNYEDTEGVEPITRFDQMGLKDGLLRRMNAYGFCKPTAIQQRAILPILEGRNVIAQGESGAGKTSMIAITVCQLVDTSITEVQALILSPKMAPKLARSHETEELIAAIRDDINIYTCLGGTRTHEDRSVLDGDRVHVVCGVTENVCPMLWRNALRTRSLKLLVLDEPDGVFIGDFSTLFSVLPPKLQVVMVSTTLSNYLLKVSRKFMTDPVKILLKRHESALKHIEQYYVEIERGDSKFRTLLDVFGTVTFSQAIIFCNTSEQVDWLTEKIQSNKFSVSAIHVDMPKVTRDASLLEFQEKRTRVLIKTHDDVPPRVDVLLEQVPLVINYELPNYPDDYIHRIARRGVTLYFVEVESEDIKILSYIEKYYNNTRIGKLPRKYDNTHIRELPRNAADLI